MTLVFNPVRPVAGVTFNFSIDPPSPAAVSNGEGDCSVASAPAVMGDDGTSFIDPPGSAAEGDSAETSWLAHRLALGVCEGAAELGDLLWLECNAAELNGVSFTKGCYVGQETTARMNWRAKVNRRLVVVPLGESDPARQRVAYPELGLAVDHRRIDTISPAQTPRWMVAEES